MAKISSRSRFKLAQIKKDFLAWHKKNRHSLQRVNFVSDNTNAITTTKYNTSYDGKQMKEFEKYKITEEVNITRQTQRRNICVLIRAHNNSFVFFWLLDRIGLWTTTSWHLYQIWQVRNITLNCKSLLCLCHTWHRFWCHASKQILSYAFLSSSKVIVLAIQLTQDELVSTTKHVTFK